MKSKWVNVVSCRVMLGQIIFVTFDRSRSGSVLFCLVLSVKINFVLYSAVRYSTVQYSKVFKLQGL